MKTFIPLDSINDNIVNLLASGFEEYHSTFEPITIDGEENMHHSIFTCTKPCHKNNGKVVDIYYNDTTAYQIVTKQ